MVHTTFGKIFCSLRFLGHFGHIFLLGLLLIGHPHPGRGSCLLTGEGKGKQWQVSERALLELDLEIDVCSALSSCFSLNLYVLGQRVPENDLISVCEKRTTEAHIESGI